MNKKIIYNDGRYKIAETENSFILYYYGLISTAGESGWMLWFNGNRDILDLVRIFKCMGRL